MQGVVVGREQLFDVTEAALLSDQLRRVLESVRGIDERARVDEPPHNGQPIRLDRIKDGRALLLIVARLDRHIVVQQQLDDGGEAVLGGKHERRLAPAVRHVYDGAVVDEVAHDFQHLLLGLRRVHGTRVVRIAPLAHQYQRRFVRMAVRIGAQVDQQPLHQLNVPLVAGVHQRVPRLAG